MKQEFNLSERFVRHYWNKDSIKDVKEFIKRVKERLFLKIKESEQLRKRIKGSSKGLRSIATARINAYENIIKDIDKIAGEDLKWKKDIK